MQFWFVHKRIINKDCAVKNNNETAKLVSQNNRLCISECIHGRETFFFGSCMSWQGCRELYFVSRCIGEAVGDLVCLYVGRG